MLDLSELNRRFFRELSDWYFWARQEAQFPAARNEEECSVAVIRLITRAMFVYFIKERGLVPGEFFNPDALPGLLKDTTPAAGTYYNAILQNLFFAALNAEPGARGWQDDVHSHHGNSESYLDSTKRRYREMFRDPVGAAALFEQVPFLNGGLFECLDTRDNKTKIETRHDGFSSKEAKRARVPNYLFWGADQVVDLNAVYQTRNRTYPVRPLLEILNRYKFTVAENTPLEEEVALDPELLGKVFENLLASYNPETRDTARRQTGSFYTPREIVDYMVEESLVAYLESAVTGENAPEAPVLRALVSYDADAPELSLAQRRALIAAVGRVTILDPACGSGAFPMGCLHRLTHLLHRLDPGGELWKAEQQRQIDALDMAEAREAAQARFDEAVARDGGDYVRKLYLIERCLFGVDIQPIAVQIAKLRFFISLVVEQKLDPSNPSSGVQPLPNLETKIVAANTLLRPNAGQGALTSTEAQRLERELFDVRRRHFSARRWSEKKKLRAKDEELRNALAVELQEVGMPADAAQQMASWNPYDQNSFAPFFDPEWMFGPELKNGFDVVIGNPPYGAHVRSFLKEVLALYPEAKKVADSYVLFIGRGIDLLNKFGILSFIVPNTFCDLEKGDEFRLWLLNSTFR